MRRLPTAQADGAYGNRPARQRAKAAGFRLQAPLRGQRQPGVGTMRQAVERCHNFFAQFGRIGRRWERSAQRFLGWIELAACVIFLRSGFVRSPKGLSIRQIAKEMKLPITTVQYYLD